MGRRSQSTIEIFIKREFLQAKHLRRALRGRYQKTFSAPRQELARLRHAKVRSLVAHNPYSRARWLRAVVARLGLQVGARPPYYVLNRPLYFVTIIDRRQLIDSNLDSYEQENPTWKAIASAYKKHLLGFDYLGMLDSALFVSAQRVFRKSRFICVHLHALVWNTNEAALKAAKLRTESLIRPLFSYTHAFDFSAIDPFDFLQLAWYVTKTPRKQYQVHDRQNGRYRQYKRAINGVNSVRLYQMMHDVTLDELALAGGEGVGLLKRVLRDVQRRR